MTIGILRRWVRVRRDQRGVVLVMAVPGFVLAVASLALSVDIGRQVLEKRSDQSVADMAALDAVRDLPNAQAAAEASAVRNGFDLAGPSNSVVAERGSVDAQRVFTVDPAGDAVRVTVTSAIDYIFAPGSKTVSAKAVGELPSATSTTASPSAGFELGSTLGSVDTTKAPLLNRVLGRWLKGTAVAGGNADVVGWQGLLDANVTLSALRDHLEPLESGVQFGTVDQLLAADLTLAQLARATADALTASGDADATLYAGPTGIIAQMTNTATFKLGKLIQVEQGAGNAALASQLNAFELLTGSAMVANGTNLVSVPDIGIAIPELGTTSLSVKVIEAKQWVIGPVTATASTGQVELTLTPVLDRPLTVTGLTAARLTGTFPFSMTAAGATGTLADIACPSPGGGSIRVTVDLKPLSGSTSSTLGVSSAGVPVFSVAATGGLAVTDPTPQDVDFAYSGDFTPTSTGKRVGASPLDLAGLSSFGVTITPLGLTPVPGTLSAAVTSDLKVVVGLLSEHVLASLHRTLGISIGAADVAALKEPFEDGCAASVTTTTPSSPNLVG